MNKKGCIVFFSGITAGLAMAILTGSFWFGLAAGLSIGHIAGYFVAD